MSAPVLAPIVKVRAFIYMFALLVGVSLHASQAPTASTTAPLLQYRGFSFSPGGCELPEPYCEIRQPKSWSSADVEVVMDALDEIAASQTGLLIIGRAQKDGYTTLRRYTQYLRFENTTPVPSPTTKAVTRHQVKAIDFNDAFFRCETARDRFSGTPGLFVPTIYVLHELLHVLDQNVRRYSGTDEFQRLVGFTTINGRLSLVARSQEEVDEWAKYVARQDDLERTGQCDAVFEVQRRYGLQVLKRLPSMQAVERPEDAFAEIGAYLVLDRNRTETYLEPAVATIS